MSNPGSVEKKKIFGIPIGKPSGKKKTAVETVVKVSTEEKQAYTYTPSLPLVNVIPQAFVEKYQIKGIVRKFTIIGVGIAATLGLIFAGGSAYILSIQGQVTALSQKQGELSNQVGALQPFQAYQVSVENKRAALLSATQADVNMGVIYQNVNSSAGSNSVDIQNLSITQFEEGAAGTECTNPDPFNTIESIESIIGCVTIQGEADDKDQVNTFLRDLESIGEENGESYRNPFISSFLTSSDEAQVSTSTFSATISFTSALYTDKYASLALSLLELIEAGSNGVDTPAVEEEPVAEEIVVELPDAGIVGAYILEQIATITPEDVRTFDTIAYTACISEDNVSALEALTALLGENYPDASIETIISDISAFLENDCVAIITTEENNIATPDAGEEN